MIEPKLSFVTQIETSKDPCIKQVLSILRSSEYYEAQSIPSSVCSILEAARHSIATITPSVSLNGVARFLLKEDHIREVDDILEDWTVQGKFKDMIKVEEENKVWNRLVTGLPVGQLSFILRVGMACLPTPLNLKRWKYCTDSTCSLCGSTQPTSLHILNGC